MCITGGRITGGILKSAIAKTLSYLESENRQKRLIASMKGRKDVVLHGKQSIKGLMEQGSQLSNIEITDKNIRSFEKCAREYKVAYGLKKDTSVSPPRYFVFFRAKDVDVMTAAFKEYTGRQLRKEKKPSVLKKLMLAKERTEKHKEREMVRQKERGMEH